MKPNIKIFLRNVKVGIIFNRKYNNIYITSIVSFIENDE